MSSMFRDINRTHIYARDKEFTFQWESPDFVAMLIFFLLKHLTVMQSLTPPTAQRPVQLKS